jgi:hypothetical protein
VGKSTSKSGYAKMRLSGRVAVMITAPPKEKKVWQAMAKMDGRSLNNWIRRVLARHIAQHGFIADAGGQQFPRKDGHS